MSIDINPASRQVRLVKRHKRSGEEDQAGRNDVEVYGVENLREAIGMLAGESEIKPLIANTREEFANRTMPLRQQTDSSGIKW